MARKIGRIQSFTSLWKAHEKLYYSIFFEALTRLKISDDQQKNEDAISEALCPVLKDICFKHESDITPPAWEIPIPPMNNTELQGGKIRKRPDFSCDLVNPQAASSKDYIISLHVECKRLGKKKKSWDLNKNYVTNGIKRFDSTEHKYGKNAQSGIMIGYIVSMEPISILEKVNQHLSDKISKLSFTFSQKVASCEQQYQRNKIEPVNFKLIHMWVNLKNKRERLH